MVLGLVICSCVLLDGISILEVLVTISAGDGLGLLICPSLFLEVFSILYTDNLCVNTIVGC